MPFKLSNRATVLFVQSFNLTQKPYTKAVTVFLVSFNLTLLVGLLFKNSPHIIYFPFTMPFQMWNYQVTNGLILQKFIWIDTSYAFLFLTLSYRDFTIRFVG